MILFNLCGAPGAGKTTTSWDLCSAFKKAGFHADLVGETARGYIYEGSLKVLGDNQFIVSAKQWERVYRLARYGAEIAVSDSPLLQSLLYAEHLPYYNQLADILKICDKQFPTYNIFVDRAFPYVAGERLQKTAEEADSYIPKIRELLSPFWMEIKGNDEGRRQLEKAALNVATSLRNAGRL